MNNLTSPEEQVVELLISRGYRISCAESCTGGLLAATLINVPNASLVLSSSFITYSEEAKVRYAGVSWDTLHRHGVVSEEVAAEMAAGVAAEAGSTVGIGITGIAGPGGGSPETPVGTVCFGCCIQSKTVTRTVCFGNPGRNEVRRRSVSYALSLLREQLTECPVFVE